MKLKNRRITKVSFGGRKGITISYVGDRPKGVPERGSFTIGADPFDELKDAAKKLSGYLVTACGIDPQAEIEKDDPARKALGKARLNMTRRITIIGITFKWDGLDIAKVKLLGFLTNNQGEGTSLNTPSIDFSRDDYYGMEESLEKEVRGLLDLINSFENGNYAVFEDATDETTEHEQPEETEEVDENDIPEAFGDTMKVVKKAKKKAA